MATRACLWLLSLGFLAGCQNSRNAYGVSAEAYVDPMDRLKAKVAPVRWLLGGACQHDISTGNVSAFIDKPIWDCVKLTPSRRMSGIWVWGFEISDYFDGKTVWRPESGETTPIWLDWRSQPSTEWQNKVQDKPVLLEFIGRQTLYPGCYGHMCLQKQAVIVDRLISVRAME